MGTFKRKWVGHTAVSDNQSSSLQFSVENKYSVALINVLNFELFDLKGTATLMNSMFYMKGLYEPLILIPVPSKSVEKYGSDGSLNICKWALMEAAIL